MSAHFESPSNILDIVVTYSVLRLVRNENAFANSCDIVFDWNDLLSSITRKKMGVTLEYPYSQASFVMVAVNEADGIADNELELKSL